MKNLIVLVYRDYGSSNPYALYNSLVDYFSRTNKNVSVEFTDSTSILHLNALKNTDTREILMLVIGGGLGVPYEQKLRDSHKNNQSANQIIIDYVKNGGRYLGICAGSYYASINTTFERDITELTVISKSGLNFIEADAIGSLYKEFNIPAYTGDVLNRKIVTVYAEELNKTFHLCYYGGPVFAMHDNINRSEYKVLAKYSDISGNNIAALFRNFAKGKVLVSSMHFETKSADIFVSEHIANYEKSKTDKEFLVHYDAENQEFFDYMMNVILA